MGEGQRTQVGAPAPSAGSRAGAGREGRTARGGLSAARLDRLRAVMGGYVERGEVPGVVALVSRGGHTHVETLGHRAFGGAPMGRDTIFRIASMTKPVTATAAMILVEECRLRLDDPVDPWLPELADRPVLRSLGAALDDTVPARRPITLRDLLTLRMGHGAVMLYPEKHPIQGAMREAGVVPGPEPPSVPPDELMGRYGGLPLLDQPGERWRYNSGSDILGVLIARVAGTTLGTFMRRRIFEPLGMKDTGFSVPAEELGRLATCYRRDPDTDGLVVFDAARGGRFAHPPVFESGAGGLVSTADDYLAFSRMMLNGGRLGDTRILSRPSIELMTADHLTPEQRAQASVLLGGGSGWGFGMEVSTHRNDLASVPGRFGWNGGKGTSGYADPREGLIGVLLTQRLMESPQPPPIVQDFWTSAYQAIAD